MNEHDNVTGTHKLMFCSDYVLSAVASFDIAEEGRFETRVCEGDVGVVRNWVVRGEKEDEEGTTLWRLEGILGLVNVY